MWLDGLYMSAPFRARYAELFNDPTEFDDIVNQFVWIASHTRDANTGLLYHAWDESRKERWSNPETGCSPNFWGRAMGWYAMALVDVLEIMPDAHPRRNELVTLLQDLSAALLKVRDPQTGLWFQVVDRKDLEGNYHEASASCMFAYAFAKGANKGYLDSTYILRAKETFEGVVANLVTVTEEGLVDLHGTCRSAGLGGTPYRDGSAGYYIGEPKRTNDMKGIGPFILAAIEIELAQTAGSK
jgi:unsaturated rhamnogalacturonyl hydrolase